MVTLAIKDIKNKTFVLQKQKTRLLLQGHDNSFPLRLSK